MHACTHKTNPYNTTSLQIHLNHRKVQKDKLKETTFYVNAIKPMHTSFDIDLHNNAYLVTHVDIRIGYIMTKLFNLRGYFVSSFYWVLHAFQNSILGLQFVKTL